MRRSPALQLELPLPFARRTELSSAHVVLGERRVLYAVRRSRRRRGSFSIAIDERGLRIGVPWNASERWIEAIVRKHEAWILRKLEEWHARRPPPVVWRNGAELMLLGTPLRLVFANGLDTLMMDGRRLLIDASGKDASDIARAVAGWLRTEARACFEARIAHYAPRLGVAPRELKLSQARTRWGSCHPDGRILLNWRIVQMPLALVDYVVAHELAHLRELNHSPRFWRVVAEVIPDYTTRRRQIRDEGPRYLVV